MELDNERLQMEKGFKFCIMCNDELIELEHFKLTR